jgi:hypothetical protein
MPGSRPRIAFGPAGAAAQACAPGTHQPARGQADCLPCPPDEYQPAAGATACLACPANTQAPQGTTALAACVAAPGFFGAPGSAATPCAPGTYQPASAQAACLACPANEYQPEAAALACRACPAGSASPPGAAAAEGCVCVAGGFWLLTGATHALTVVLAPPNRVHALHPTLPLLR